MEIRLFGKFAKGEPKEYKIAVGIVTYPNVIFLAQRKYNAIYFPGGTLEPEEDYLSCLKREVKEEIGLEVEKISKKYIETNIFSPKKDSYIKVLTFAGKVSGEINIKKDEIESIIIAPFEIVDKNFIMWLNKRYLIGPNVIDCFINKKEDLFEIINEIQT